jgi:hypothetical protein
VDTREGHQVSLELGQVDVQSTIKSETGRDGANDLSDQAVEVLVAGPGDVQVATTDVVDGLVVNQEGAIRVLDGAVGGQNGVVWFHDRSGHARRGIDGELQLGLLAIVSGETLQKESAEARTSTTTKGVEDQETLQRRAVV